MTKLQLAKKEDAKEVFSKHTGVPVEDLFEKQHA